MVWLLVDFMAHRYTYVQYMDYTDLTDLKLIYNNTLSHQLTSSLTLIM